MDDQRLYSTRIIKTYLEYVRVRYPDLDTEGLLDYANILESQIEDEGHFFSQLQVNLFHERLLDITGNRQIAREAGRYAFSSGAYSTIRQCVLGFLSPGAAFSMVSRVASGLTRATTYEAKEVYRDKIEIIVKPLPGVVEMPFQCENRLGTFEALGRLFINKFPRIEHPECLNEGGSCCKYVVSMDGTPNALWRRVRRYLLILPAPAVLSFFFFPIAGGIAATALLFGGVATAAYLFERSQKERLMVHVENQGDAAAQLIEQTNKHYNRTLLIQEIGQAISNMMDVDFLLAQVMETLERYLDYDRGVIFLSTPDNTKIEYKVAYGFSEAQLPLLSGFSFDVENLSAASPFAGPLWEQRVILVNRARDIEPRLTIKAAELLRHMDVESFLCAPIVYKGRSLGLLLVDNVRSRKPLSQGDVNLLQGIANQIAISINNAVSYQKVLESESRFRSLSENAPDIICHMMRDGTITYVNALWERILGHSREEVLGRRFIDFIRPEDLEVHSATFRRIWNTKENAHNVESGIISKSEGAKFFSANIAPDINPEGHVIGTVVIMTDITDKRRLETQLRQAQKMEAIGTLAGGIAHDFNNILAAIMGYTEIAMSDLDSEHPVRHYLDQVLQSSFRAKDLIKQILAFSRQTEQEFKPLKIGPIVKEVAKLLRASIPATIEIRFSISTWEDTILGDPTQVHQVMMNLCTNAAYAMTAKGGHLDIELGRIDVLPEKAVNDFHVIGQEPHLMLTVRDNGHGMDAMTLSRIFDPFFTTKKPGEGTGMGLSVVHGIVKSHKGAILVDSKSDQGTTIRVFFPLLREESSIKEAHEIPRVVGGNETILFVDDELPLIQLGREVLERLGYHVLTGTNGMDALKVFSAQPDAVDLVITDLTMPQMTGLELTEELQKIRPDIPIIVCTGFSELLTIERARKLGIRDVMMKPIVGKKIAMAIRRELNAMKLVGTPGEIAENATPYEAERR